MSEDTMKRQQDCKAEIEEVLKKHNCKPDVTISISTSGTIKGELNIVALPNPVKVETEIRVEEKKD